jgi:hypothetical protein
MHPSTIFTLLSLTLGVASSSPSSGPSGHGNCVDEGHCDVEGESLACTGTATVCLTGCDWIRYLDRHPTVACHCKSKSCGFALDIIFSSVCRTILLYKAFQG